MTYRAEYLWIDGVEPQGEIRSKTKILANDEAPPVWGFDGSSTSQASGDNSDLVLKPVFTCGDPVRGGDNIWNGAGMHTNICEALAGYN